MQVAARDAAPLQLDSADPDDHVPQRPRRSWLLELAVCSVALLVAADVALRMRAPLADPDAASAAASAAPTAASAAPATARTEPAAAVAERLSARFRAGRASSDVAAAGVLLRSFDNTENSAEPWRACADEDPSGDPAAGLACLRYRTSGHVVSVRRGGSFGRNGTRNPRYLSASIVYASMQAPRGGRIPLFSAGPGVVYRPCSARGCVSIACSYAGDGHTRAGEVARTSPEYRSAALKTEDGCGDDFCEGRAAARQARCPEEHVPYARLASMLAAHAKGGSAEPETWFNEAIIDAAALDELLPEAVEAFFAQSEETVRYARYAQRSFARAYRVAPPPVLLLDPANWTSPLRDAFGD